MDGCKWPQGACACYMQQAEKADYAGRIWMYCEEGLSLSKASMSRFIMFCLLENIEIGSIHPFNPNYKGSQVSAAIRIRPEQIPRFESETRGKLRKPPKVSLNTSTPGNAFQDK